MSTVYDRVIITFENNILDNLRSDALTGKLAQDGRLRERMRAEMLRLVNSTGFETEDQVSFLQTAGKAFEKYGEYSMAQDAMNLILDKCSCFSDEVRATKVEIEAVHTLARCSYAAVVAEDQHQLAPMAVGKILGCLQKICDSLDLFLGLSTKAQESHAYLVLNACKLLFDMGHPLIWISCGKYIIEMSLFGIMCMNSVINLCTPRHLNFRMKMYSSVFLAAVTQDTADMATVILNHATAAVSELRAREELETPVPPLTLRILSNAECDLDVLKQVLSFWKDAESFDPVAAVKENPKYTEQRDKNLFAEKCFLESCRVQQLTTGNINEPWKKRSRGLLKAFIAFTEGDGFDPTELSVRCISDMMSSVLFDVSADEGSVVKLRALVGGKLEAVLPPDPTEDESVASGAVMGHIADFEVQQLSMLKALLVVMDSRAINQQNLLLIKNYLSEIAAMTFSEELMKRRTFFQRAAIGVWNRCIFPALRIALNREVDKQRDNLKLLVDPLLSIMEIMTASLSHDPVFVGGVAVTTAHVLREVGHSRECVEHVLRSLEYVEDHRAGRTDIRLQCPEDVRDILALQHQAVSVRSEYKNWFHAYKRLGAHAFAGFGIFGASSSMYRGDVALSEIHADLLTCYFSEEIAYAIAQRNLRGSDVVTHKMKKSKHGATKAAGEKAADPTPLVKIEDPDQEGVSKLAVGVSEMAISKQLRAWCKKNSYAKCLLLLEMARVEALAEERLLLVTEAAKCVELVEQRERDIIDAFSDLTVMTDRVQKHPIILSRSHKFFYVLPVGCRTQKKASFYKILAREEGSGTDLGPSSDELSGCDVRVLKSVLQYPSANIAVRIDVPVANEKYVFGTAAFRENGQLLQQNAVSPTSIPVEAVNPLSTLSLWGQIAVVASGFEDCLQVAHKAADVVCSRYFMVSPQPSVRNVGRMGFNLFACEEPAISALVVHQSSEQQLYTLVKSFIITQQKEGTGVERTLREIPVHGALRSEFQVDVLNSVKRLALVTTIASFIKSHELVSQCIYLGYQLCSQLLREDDFSLAAYLSQSLIVFIAAMQQIPKAQWHEIEHVVYCRLVSEAIKCATITKNIEAFSRLIENVHSDGSPSIVSENSPILNAVYQSLISTIHHGQGFFLTSDIKKQLIGITSPGESSPRGGDLQLWLMSSVERFQVLRGLSLEVVSSKGAVGPGSKAPIKGQPSNISKANSSVAPSSASGPKLYSPEEVIQAWSAAIPENMSDMIFAVVFWVKELVSKNKLDLVVELLKMFRIKRCMLVEPVQVLCREWKLDFLDNSEPVAERVAEGAEPSPRSGAGSQSRPGTTGDTDRGLSRGSAGGDGGDVIDAAEKTAQIQALGELVMVLAEAVLQDASVAEMLQAIDFDEQSSTEGNSKVRNSEILPASSRRTYHSKTLDGPLAVLDPHDPEAALSQTEIDKFGEVPSSPVVNEEENVQEVVPDVPNDLVAIRYLCCALVFFGQCGASNAAVDVTCRLWNLVVDGWVHPKTFALECMAVPVPVLPEEEPIAEDVHQEEKDENKEVFVPHTMKKIIVLAAEALAHVLEVVSGIFEDEDLGAADSAFFQDQSNETSRTMTLATCTVRESKEYLCSVRNVANYLVKVLWLFRSWREVVEIGTRVTAVYSQAVSLDISRAIMESTWGYIIHSQSQLKKMSHEKSISMQAELDKFIGDWNDAQSKKRKKKARIARVEKDADEIAFENARNDLEEELQRLNTLFQVEQNRLDGFNADQKRILGSQPIGLQLLDRVRHVYRDLMLECYTALSPEAMKQIFDIEALDPLTGSSSLPLSEQNKDAFACLLLSNRVLAARFDGIQKDYDEISSFFREKKDIVGLVEALHEQGDILLLFGKPAEARAVWNDAVDGIFHSIDATNNWQHLVTEALANSNAPEFSHFVTCMYPVVAILGKLSAFCASNDFDKKSDYCRLAATLCRVPFNESLCHPKTLAGFSTYECTELGGVGYLLCNSSRLSAAALSFALAEILDVLVSESEYLLALPCVVILEHFHTCYTMRADYWLNARLRRVRILVQLHFFSEAASMISGIGNGVKMVAAKKHNVAVAEFEELRKGTQSTEAENSGSAALNKYEVSENGFDFFGLAPYWNNKPPDDDLNKEAISWILGYPTIIWEQIRECPFLRVDGPAGMAPIEPEAAPALTKANSKVPSKQPSTLKQSSTLSGAQIDKVGSVVGDSSEGPGIDSLITAKHLSALKIECLYFVAELFTLDTKFTSKCRPYWNELTASVEAELSQVVSELTKLMSIRKMESDDPFANDTSGKRSPRSAKENKNQCCWCDPEWVAQYTRSNWLLISVIVHQKRNLLAARAGVVCLQKVLIGGMDTARTETQGDVPYNTLTIVKNTWVMCNYMLADISERQGRLDDAIRLVTKGAEEVSTMCWSHWLRYFLSQRARIFLKIGKLGNCEMDCDSVLSSFQYNCSTLLDPPKLSYAGQNDNTAETTSPIGSRTRLTSLLVRMLALKASVLRLKSVSDPSESVVYASMHACMKLSKAAFLIAKSLAAMVGFLGSDTNATYNTVSSKLNTSMVSDHHLFPPLIHSLTDIHPNDPLLSIDPAPKKYSCVSGSAMNTTIISDISKKPVPRGNQVQDYSPFLESMRKSRSEVLAQYSGEVSFGFFHRPELRLGPVDGIGPSGDEVVYTCSPFANIHLSEVRLLAVSVSALGRVVADAEPLLVSQRKKSVHVKGVVSSNEDEIFEGESHVKGVPIDIFTELAAEEGLKVRN